MTRDRKTSRVGTPRNVHFALNLALFCVLPFLFTPISFGAEKIASLDFESEGWESQFTGQNVWGDNITRTTHDPFSGSYSLRWNQDSGREDPITGLMGIGNSLLDWRGDHNIPAQTPNEMYFSMRFRHDDYSNDAEANARKLFYFVDNVSGGDAVRSNLIGNQFGNQNLRMSYHNGTDRYDQQWAWDNWGHAIMWLDNSGVSPSLDGEWRHFEFYINYNEHYMILWLDGYILYPTNPTYRELYPEDAAAGRIVYSEETGWHYKGFQIGFFSPYRDCVNCEDESEYSAGFQIDDLEVWNGMPGSPPEPDSPGQPGQPQLGPPSSS